MDIRKVASILDDLVEKAEEGTVEHYEEQIQKSLSGDLKKGLSFDPMIPYEMGPTREKYYNPYRTLSDGSYAPHSVEHWTAQGKNASDYTEVKEFLTEAGYYKKSEEATKKLRELPDLIKALPVGTIHEWKGVKFQKISENPATWKPVSEGHQGMGFQDQPGSGGHAEMESRAQRHADLQSEIKKRKQQKESQEAATQEATKRMVSAHEAVHGKESADKMREHLKKQEGERKEADKKERAEKKAKDSDHVLTEKIKRRNSGEGAPVELSKAEIENILTSGKFALISAGKNPNHPKEADMDENDEFFEKRYGQLKDELVEGGYMFNDVSGKYEGGLEKTFLVMVHDHDDDHILELGKKYNQDSVVLSEAGKHKLHFTTGDNEGMHHAGEGWSDASDADDNFTEFETEDGHILKFNLNLDFGKLQQTEKKGKSLKQKKLLAKGDEGRPTNNMGMRDFMMPGKEVGPDQVDGFIKRFHNDFQKMTRMDDEVMNAGGTHFASRLKDPNSLLTKMQGRLAERSLNTVTDVIGSRAMAGSLEDQQKILKSIRKKYDIVEIEDSSKDGREDGYRATHILFRTPSGKIGELQIKTHNQQAWAGYTHDNIYKGKPEIKNNKQVQKYTKQLSDYLSKLDQGAHDDPEQRPEEPQILKDKGLLFDWGQIHAERPLAPEGESKGKLKHYVVVRDKNKVNHEVKEFNSFKEAQSHADQMREKGHEGELPIGYARDKNTFLFTFNEYKPKGKVKKSDEGTS